MSRKSRIWIRALALVLVVAAYMLCPDPQHPFGEGHWNSSISWINPAFLGSLRLMLLGPLIWGLSLLLLLACIQLLMEQKGMYIHLHPRMKVTAGIITGVMLVLGLYWTWGFMAFSVYPPMPFQMGYYIMNHRFILNLWWMLCALLLHVAVMSKRPPKTSELP